MISMENEANFRILDLLYEDIERIDKRFEELEREKE